MKIIFEILDAPAFHEDMFMKILDLNIFKVFDSYYFWSSEFTFGKEKVETIKNIEKYFLLVRNRLSTLKIGEVLFLPLDFSDQYFGGFRIRKRTAHIIEGTYCLIYDIQDSVIESRNSETYNNLGDKTFDSEFTFESDIDSFRNSFYLKIV